MGLLNLARSRVIGTARWMALAAAALALTSPTPGRAASLESAVKANYLFKFTPFVEWPPRAFTSAVSPFSFCVLGADPFGGALDQVAAGQSVGQHPAVVRRIANAAGAGGCQLLYVGAAPPERAREALLALRGAPILTVSEDGQGSLASVIQFVIVGGRVKFSVDAAAARANGIAISSKLLALATEVRGR